MIDKDSGFSLVELMATLALAALVITLAVPSFQGLLRKTQLSTSINDFITAIQLARSEAITRATRVTLCKSADGLRCATRGGYEQGWIVFADPNSNAVVDTNETVIRVFQAISAKAGMTFTGRAPLTDYISYTPDGVARRIDGGFQAGALLACAASTGRQILLNSMGRVRVVEANCP